MAQQSETIIIRRMNESDPEVIAAAEVAQGWIHASPSKYEMRLRDQAQGLAIALVAEYNGEVAGYIHVYPARKAGPFSHGRYPEIVDFGVLEKFRRRGIGSRLMDAAEETAARFADTVYLAVGLHSGYGSAQRMYVKRGYIPDGSGVWYGDHPCEPYSTCCNDDDLNLYFSKKLSGSLTFPAQNGKIS